MATKVSLRPPKSTNHDALKQSQSAGMEFNTKNNQKVQLDSKRLADVFKQSEIDISRFGFQSPNDLITFLKSPAGESTLEHIGEELAQIAAIEEYHQFQFQEEERLKQRITVALLLYFASKEDAHAKALERYIEQQLEKHLHSEKEIMEREAEANASEPQKNDSLVDQIVNNRTELAHVDNKIQKLEQQIREVKAHEIYLDNIEKVEQDTIGTIDIKELTSDPARKEQKIQELSEKITKAEHKTRQAIEAYMAAGEAYAKNEMTSEEVDIFKRQLDMYQLEEETLKDIKAVIEGEKILLNEHCQPVYSFDKAKFVVNKDLADRLVKSEGKYYLLKPDQEFSEMSLEEKEKAHSLFIKNAPDLQRMSHLIQERHTAVKEFLGDEQTLKTSLSKVQAEKDQLQMEHGRLNEKVQNFRTNAQPRPTAMSRPADGQLEPPTSPAFRR
ncbi:hypothetical protein [Legionella impletisoli]|uniref:LidA long coiled-coil domain-containing protein n=1 Tax=Legionella impletisoli TaxID=343510 RepID=A0A917JY49_9GAMM|nr:hypothetical protein [Legionella impletisoli]GGI91752.1 hypothetical protein GCM10007966_20550 [Legionella impletisoli]